MQAEVADDRVDAITVAILWTTQYGRVAGQWYAVGVLVAAEVVW